MTVEESSNTPLVPSGDMPAKENIEADEPSFYTLETVELENNPIVRKVRTITVNDSFDPYKGRQALGSQLTAQLVDDLDTDRDEQQHTASYVIDLSKDNLAEEPGIFDGIKGLASCFSTIFPIDYIYRIVFIAPADECGKDGKPVYNIIMHSIEGIMKGIAVNPVVFGNYECAVFQVGEGIDAHKQAWDYVTGSDQNA